ncbi:hypothetical protein FB451DRAFT_1560794 [Mycena latifolia]|nr:hypothetical protein FB451DRAFT_1560794 [Mycena latifolia]
MPCRASLRHELTVTVTNPHQTPPTASTSTRARFETGASASYGRGNLKIAFGRACAAIHEKNDITIKRSIYPSVDTIPGVSSPRYITPPQFMLTRPSSSSLERASLTLTDRVFIRRTPPLHVARPASPVGPAYEQQEHLRARGRSLLALPRAPCSDTTLFASSVQRAHERSPASAVICVHRLPHRRAAPSEYHQPPLGRRLKPPRASRWRRRTADGAEEWGPGGPGLQLVFRVWGAGLRRVLLQRAEEYVPAVVRHSELVRARLDAAPVRARCEAPRARGILAHSPMQLSRQDASRPSSSPPRTDTYPLQRRARACRAAAAPPAPTNVPLLTRTPLLARRHLPRGRRLVWELALRSYTGALARVLPRGESGGDVGGAGEEERSLGN